MDNENEFLEKSKKIFQKRKIALILYYSSIVIVIISSIFINISRAATIIIFGIGVLCFISFIVILYAYWKCPCCGRNLEIRGSNGMTHCPYCGAKIGIKS